MKAPECIRYCVDKIIDKTAENKKKSAKLPLVLPSKKIKQC